MDKGRSRIQHRRGVVAENIVGISADHDADTRLPAESRSPEHPDGGPTCPLSDEEIAHWVPRLGSASYHSNERAAREKRLRDIITDWFDRAGSLYRVRMLPPNWPDAPVRVDNALPEIAGRLEAIRSELLKLPGSVTAALRVRFANYDLALTALGALPMMLNEIAAAWYKPHRGQPKLGIEAEVIGFLIKGLELFTGEKLPPPRSEKRKAEFEFLRLLTARLLPKLTDAQFRTALRHWDASRQAAKS